MEIATITRNDKKAALIDLKVPLVEFTEDRLELAKQFFTSAKKHAEEYMEKHLACVVVSVSCDVGGYHFWCSFNIKYGMTAYNVVDKAMQPIDQFISDNFKKKTK